MTRHIEKLAQFGLLLALTPACEFFGNTSSDKAGQVVPAQGGATSAGTGGSGVTGGTGGAGNANGAAGGTSGCSGVAGPAMVEVHAPNGTAYCIDRTEVSEGDYATFLKETKMQPGSEDERCGLNNTSYQPLNNAPDPYEIKDCVNVWSPDSTPKRPVVCIDWCDALAYCKWAGKRLCGKVGGGPGSIDGNFDASDSALSATQSQWFNACSQGGKTKYPYGDTYDPNACAGADVSKGDAGGYQVWLPRKDVGAWSACRGQTSPYSEILDLSGSVAELTDECLWETTSGGGAWNCAVRGGGYTETSSDLQCGPYHTGAQVGVDIGFRCCQDLP